MTKKEILEGNKIIAEFMGAKFVSNFTNEIYKEPYPTFVFDIVPTEHASKLWGENELQYENDWNWLMPVVEKIEALNKCSYIIIIKGYLCDIYKTTRIDEDGKLGTLRDVLLVSEKHNVKIELVWMSIIKFINLYNKK